MNGKMRRRTIERWNGIRKVVVDFRERERYGPSLRDVQLAVGLSSPANAKYHIDRMIKAGWLTGNSGKARTLNVPEDARPAGRSGLWAAITDALTVRVPVLGEIGAAVHFELPDAVDIDHVSEFDVIEMPASTVGKAYPVYALKVRGDSMIDDLVADGDMVIIQPSKTAHHGETVAARINRDGQETRTLKKYIRRDISSETIILQPANPNMGPIEVHENDCHIEGKVIAVLRQS